MGLEAHRPRGGQRPEVVNPMPIRVDHVTHIVADPVSDLGDEGWCRSFRFHGAGGTHLEITAYADDPIALEVETIEEESAASRVKR